jgi:hypothetical protein
LLALRYSSGQKGKTVFSDPGEGTGNQFMPERKHNEHIVSLHGEMHSLFTPTRERTPVDNIRVAQFSTTHANNQTVSGTKPLLRNISGSNGLKKPPPHLEGSPRLKRSQDNASFSKDLLGSVGLKNACFLMNLLGSSGQKHNDFFGSSGLKNVSFLNNVCSSSYLNNNGNLSGSTGSPLYFIYHQWLRLKNTAVFEYNCLG